MTFRIYLRNFAVPVLAAFCLARATAHAEGARPGEAFVHDPSVIRVDDTYYVFGSHLASASTKDLRHWKQLSNLPVDGNPLSPNSKQEFAETLAWAKADTFWAPCVIRLGDGKYYHYYCACEGHSPLSALGVAVSDEVTGPLHNLGILLKSGMKGPIAEGGPVYDSAVHPNAVDPTVFFDKEGKLWMVYGSFSGGLFILKLDPKTGMPYPNQGYGKHLIGGNNTTIEGPFITYSPETDYYYLFMTFGILMPDGGYNMRVARSRSPDGPYVDAEGFEMTKVAGAPGSLFDSASIAPHGVKLMGNYQFRRLEGEPGEDGQAYMSPGGSSLYRDPDLKRYLLFFHTRFEARERDHEVRVHQLFLNEEGWFVASPYRFAGEALKKVDVTSLPGTYQFVDHGKNVSAEVHRSFPVKLQPDGSLAGGIEGSWKLQGDYFATLEIAGKTYRGVFVTVWNEDAKAWVPSFTVVSREGVSLWGCRAP